MPEIDSAHYPMKHLEQNLANVSELGDKKDASLAYSSISEVDLQRASCEYEAILMCQKSCELFFEARNDSDRHFDAENL